MSLTRVGARRGRRPRLGAEWINMVRAESPLWFYRFEETSGTTINDASPNARNGTLNGASANLAQPGAIATDPSAKGIKLNGSATYISIAHATWMNVTSAFGAGGWYNPGTSNYSNAGVLSRWGNANGGSNDWLLWYNASGNTMEFLASIGGSNRTLALNMPAKNKWTFIVFGYDGANMYVYFDGLLVGSAAFTGALASGSGDINVGSYQSGSWLAQGWYDDWFMLDHMPSAATVSAMYNSALV